MIKLSGRFLVGAALLALVQATPVLAQDQVEGAAAVRTAVERKGVVRVIAAVRTPPAAVSIETPEIALQSHASWTPCVRPAPVVYLAACGVYRSSWSRSIAPTCSA
jgi:hypothetical protein